VGTAAPGSPAEHRSAIFGTSKTCRAMLDRTENGCPHVTAGRSPHERDARAYIAPKPILLYYELTLYFLPNLSDPSFKENFRCVE
jgi:hypothetical protein